MLEIRNLTKIYQTKGGDDVKALDDVSINFEETGLVFLLGKSGSGKSTLLNLAGGLDEPTSGEVIVMGKSSKEFTGSDFDSYRNTFIGFVFQEYNVLNEFNVEENISLALELQGKTKNKEKVQAILDEVELGDYAKRKPNTLSGGQKQRIAIARALVKDPQIIMADEPTGALDSATGKQVFDTLKKLSKTRLVIVVSHDREFAEVYGDRIVELKDGKIIADVTKVKANAEAVGNINRIGMNTLSISRDAEIDDQTMGTIREFLTHRKGDVIISTGDKEVAAFKKANRIDDSGAQERFDDTDFDKLNIKEYDGSKTEFIRSRLPAQKAVRIGVASLKLKPLRLVLTILLSFISFVMFGLFSTVMLYDQKTVLVRSFRDSEYDYIMLNKQYHVKEISYYNDDSYEYDQYESAFFTPAEVAKYGDDAMGVYRMAQSITNLESDKSNVYYQPSVSYIAVLDEDHPMRSKITGEYPKNENEICISKYLAECILNGRFFPITNGVQSNVPITVQAEEDLIGEYLGLGRYNLMISGIFDNGEIPAKYAGLKEGDATLNPTLSGQFSSYVYESLMSLAFVDKAFVNTVDLTGGRYEYIQRFDNGTNRFFAKLPEGDDSIIYNSTNRVRIYKEGDDELFPVVRLDGATGSLTAKQLIVSSDFVFRMAESKVNKESLDKQKEISDFYKDNIQALNDEVHELERRKTECTSQLGSHDSNSAEWKELDAEIKQLTEDISKLNQRIRENEIQYDNLTIELNEIKGRLAELRDYSTLNNIKGVLAGGNIFDETIQDYRKPTDEEYQAAIDFAVDKLGGPVDVDLYLDKDGEGKSQGTYRIVGFYYSKDESDYVSGYYCSTDFYNKAEVVARQVYETNYVIEEDAQYFAVMVPIVKNETDFDGLFSGINTLNTTTDVRYVLNNSLYESVRVVDDMMSSLSTILLVGGLVLAVFASLLLFNFISMSISNKKQEIGILRAVGARGIDVFKIFFAESGIIVGICLILAIIGSFISTAILNYAVRARAGLGVTLFNFEPLSILIMVAVAVVVAVVATFLPVYMAARKKPVESIRSL